MIPRHVEVGMATKVKDSVSTINAIPKTKRERFEARMLGQHSNQENSRGGGESGGSANGFPTSGQKNSTSSYPTLEMTDSDSNTQSNQSKKGLKANPELNLNAVGILAFHRR